MKNKKVYFYVVGVVAVVLLVIGALFITNRLELFIDNNDKPELEKDLSDEDIALDSDKYTLSIGDEGSLISYVTDTTSDKKDNFELLSNSNSKVLSVNEDGNYVALEEGTAEVKFLYADKEYTYTFTVNVETSNAGVGLRFLNNLSLNSRVKNVPTKNDAWIGQGFCSTDNYYVALKLHKENDNNSYSYGRIYNKHNNKLVRRFKRWVGHGNGMACNEIGNGILKMYVVAGYNFGMKKNKYYELTYDTKNNTDVVKEKKYFPSTLNYVNGVAYDNVTGKYYINSYTSARSSFVYEYNFDTQQSKLVINKIRHNNQDIAVHNGILYAIHGHRKIKKNINVTNLRNGMDVYNVHNGSYIGTYIVPKTNDLELESMDFYNGNKFMLYFHLNGHRNGNKSRVYITTIK